MTIRTRRRIVWLVGLGALLVASPAVAATADEADDVCNATADPCYVTKKYDIVSGSVLDFGTRTLHLSGGQFDFEAGHATVLAGDIVVTSWGGGARLNVRGVIGGSGGNVGGRAVIKARGSCVDDTDEPCLSDGDCTTGACGTTTGTITLDDNVRGDAHPGGSITFVAYKSFSSSQVMNLSNGGQNSSEADGGEIDITAVTGAVTIDGRLDIDGGNDAQGGSVTISAATDITIDEWIDATGGDGGGGTVELEADRDALINDDINARADVGEGLGGDVTVKAGRDITFTGTSSTNNTVVHTKGHASGGEAGSGGQQVYEAGGVVTIGTHVTLRSDGPASHGDGGTIRVWGCEVSVAANSTIDATGDNGGHIHIVGRDEIFVDADADVDAGANNEEDGTIVLRTHDVTATNPDTESTQTQFDPAPRIEEDDSLPTGCAL